MKKMLKSLIAFLVVTIMAFSFTACLETSSTSHEESNQQEVTSVEESEEKESGVKTPSEAKARLKNKGYSVYSISGKILDALKKNYQGITGGFNGYFDQDEVTVYIFDTDENALKASEGIEGYKLHVSGNVVVFGTEKGVADAKKAFNF